VWCGVVWCGVVWCAVLCRQVSQLSVRSEGHVRPEDPTSPAAEVKVNEMVCPLHTLRWAAMQNVLADLVRAMCALAPFTACSMSNTQQDTSPLCWVSSTAG